MCVVMRAFRVQCAQGWSLTRGCAVSFLGRVPDGLGLYDKSGSTKR